jgi:Restriction endonuclease
MMAKISAVDVRVLDDVFEMHGGYVLDFSNRRFSEFFESEVGINIYQDTYALNGTSKANRLRTFLRSAPDLLAAKALRALWDYRFAISGPSNDGDQAALHRQDRFFQIVHAMDGKGAPRQAQTASPTASSFEPDRQALDALSDRLLQLTALKGQDRGYAFERFLADLFDVYRLDPRRSFKLVGEQIDGSFELPPETFLLEAKWQDPPVGQADLLVFAGKVEGKAQWSRGLCISYSGFSKDGLQAFARGRSTSIICMDGLDLSQILSGQLNLIEVIQRKKRRAAETGNAFVPVRDLFASVT